MSKKLGFVDLYIDEWHANNYPNWIKEARETTGLDYELTFAYGKYDNPTGRTTAKWCEDFGVTMCATIEELCEKSDAIFVLAPSNPESHLELASAVLPFGKPTFIDKTFAPDLETAKKIFAIAEKFNTPFFSSSALRYAAELDEIENVKGFTVMGGGSNLPEYFIHLGEMTIRTFHDKPIRVRSEKTAGIVAIDAVFPGDREAHLLWGPAFPYNFHVSTFGGAYCYKACNSAFFPRLLCDCLRFFDTKKAPFDPAETLNIMSFRDAALTSFENGGEWVETK